MDAHTVYNPVSVMKCFLSREFKNYWFETGTPSFLLKIMKQQPVTLGDLIVPELAFSAYDPVDLDILPLLVQTGYLTIISTEKRGMATRYKLGFPNNEIEQAFSFWLAAEFSDMSVMQVDSAR